MGRKVLVLTVAFLGLMASSAAATTITVTTTADVVANDGKCSLREAITAANTDMSSGAAPGECPAGTPGGNEIVLPPGTYSLTLAPPPGGDQSNTGGALDVSSPITIMGQGVGETTMNGDGLDRVLDVSAEGNLSLRDLGVVGGHAANGASATGTAPGTSGGSGGGIRSAGSLTLEDVTVSDNDAGNGGAAIAGSATGDAPGSGGNGGGIESTGPSLTIVDSTITANAAGTGGAGNAGSATGGAGGSGGGIDVGGGAVTVTGSTINGNGAANGGGGGLVGGVAGNGGGLFLSDPDPATLENDTIVSNTAGHTGLPLPPAGDSSAGGAMMQDGGAVAMTQVTIAYNSESGCCDDIATNGGMTVSDSALETTCSAGVADGGHNVALGDPFDAPGCPGRPASGIDEPTYGPGFDLGPLQNNGGPTETMLPEPGSILIDFVPATGAGCLPTDQRGVTRPQGAARDAGAVEVQVPPLQVPPLIVALHPGRLKFGRLRLAHTRRRSVRLTYVSGEYSGLILGRARITGRNARDFKVVVNRCRGKVLGLSHSCTLIVSFKPHKRGIRTAKVTIVGSPVTISVVGTGAR